MSASCVSLELETVFNNTLYAAYCIYPPALIENLTYDSGRNFHWVHQKGLISQPYLQLQFRLHGLMPIMPHHRMSLRFFII